MATPVHHNKKTETPSIIASTPAAHDTPTIAETGAVVLAPSTDSERVRWSDVKQLQLDESPAEAASGKDDSSDDDEDIENELNNRNVESPLAVNVTAPTPKTNKKSRDAVPFKSPITLCFERMLGAGKFGSYKE